MTASAKKTYETIKTNTRNVTCDGNNKDSGHPRVSLKIGPTETQVTCPYCSRVFILKEKK